MEFEWDLQKEILNFKKHGFSFTEATECFYDPNGLQFEDLKHSDIEPR